MATIPANTFNLKLCFTTATCPEWTAAAIVDGMSTYGYEGVELRIGKGHLHGVELDSSPDYLADVRKQFDEGNLAVACLATSFSFTSPEAAERKKVLEGVKQSLRLSEALGAPYVRILGGEGPAGIEPTGVVDYVSESLSEVAEFAEKEKVRATVLLETQGFFSHSKYVLEVISQVYSSKVAVLWDPLHPIRVLEKVEDTYDALGDHIRHIHVHDCAFNDDRTKIVTCLPGEGFVPMTRVVDLLKAGAFRGYLSVENVKQDVDPDEMLPQFATYLKDLVSAPVKA